MIYKKKLRDTQRMNRKKDVQEIKRWRMEGEIMSS